MRTGIHVGVDVMINRLPPDTRRFWEQRVRQAYDEFAQPLRMACFLGILPAAVAYRLWRARHNA